MKEYLKEKVNDILSEYYLHVETRNNAFIFNIDASLLGKKHLLIVHRSSGKRFLKNIKMNKVKFHNYEIDNLFDLSSTDKNENIIPNENNIEYFDIYIKNQFLKWVIRERSPSLLKNKRIKIFNPEYRAILTAYTTINGNLSLSLLRSEFNHSIKNINSVNNCLNIEGKIKLFEDLGFEQLEIVAQNVKTHEKKYFKCQYSKNNRDIDFVSLIDFKVDENHLNSTWEMSIRLKNDGIIIAENFIDGTILTKHRVNEDKFCLFKKELIKIKFSKNLKNGNFKNSNEEYKDVVCLALSSNFHLKLQILTEEKWNKEYQKAKNKTVYYEI